MRFGLLGLLLYLGAGCAETTTTQVIPIVQAELPATAVKSEYTPPTNDLGFQIELKKGQNNSASLPALDGIIIGKELGLETTRASFDPTGQYLLTIHSGCGQCRSITKLSWPSLDPVSRIEFPKEAGTDPSRISYVSDIFLNRSAETAYVIHNGSSLLREWRMSDGKLVNEFGVDEQGIKTVILAENAPVMAVQSTSGKITIFDAETNKTTLEIPPRQVDELWANSSSRKPRFTENGFPYPRPWVMKSIALSPDGGLLARSFADASVEIFDVGSGALIDTILIDRAVIEISFSRDASTLIMGTEQLIRFEARGRSIVPEIVVNTGELIAWEIETNKEVWRSVAHANYVDDIVLASTGDTIATLGGADPYARIWDIQTGEEIASFLAGFPSAASIAFTPDATALLTPDETALLRLYDIEKATPAEQPQLCPYTVCQ